MDAEARLGARRCDLRQPADGLHFAPRQSLGARHLAGGAHRLRRTGVRRHPFTRVVRELAEPRHHAARGAGTCLPRGRGGVRPMGQQATDLLPSALSPRRGPAVDGRTRPTRLEAGSRFKTRKAIGPVEVDSLVRAIASAAVGGRDAGDGAGRAGAAVGAGTFRFVDLEDGRLGEHRHRDRGLGRGVLRSPGLLPVWLPDGRTAPLRSLERFGGSLGLARLGGSGLPRSGSGGHRLHAAARRQSPAGGTGRLLRADDGNDVDREAARFGSRQRRVETGDRRHVRISGSSDIPLANEHPAGAVQSNRFHQPLPGAA